MSGQRCSLCDYELGDDYRTQCDGLCFDETSTCEERWRERQRTAPKPAADLGPAMSDRDPIGLRGASFRLSHRQVRQLDAYAEKLAQSTGEPVKRSGALRAVLRSFFDVDPVAEPVAMPADLKVWAGEALREYDAEKAADDNQPPPRPVEVLPPSNGSLSCAEEPEAQAGRFYAATGELVTASGEVIQMGRASDLATPPPRAGRFERAPLPDEPDDIPEVVPEASTAGIITRVFSESYTSNTGGIWPHAAHYSAIKVLAKWCDDMAALHDADRATVAGQIIRGFFADEWAIEHGYPFGALVKSPTRYGKGGER